MRQRLGPLEQEGGVDGPIWAHLGPNMQFNVKKVSLHL